MPTKKVTLWNVWTKAITVLSAIGMIVGGSLFFVERIDTKYARADEVKETKVLLADSLKKLNKSIGQTNLRINMHGLEDRARYIKLEMKEIAAECGTNNSHAMPTSQRRRYEEYEIELDKINKDMQSMGTKY